MRVSVKNNSYNQVLKKELLRHNDTKVKDLELRRSMQNLHYENDGLRDVNKEILQYSYSSINPAALRQPTDSMIEVDSKEFTKNLHQSFHVKRDTSFTNYLIQSK